MYSYTFKNIEPNAEIDFSSNVIWVFHADKTPPHIGFSTQNEFYSLKATGKDQGLNVTHVMELIQRKPIPSLLIQLASSCTLEQLKNEYEKYDRAVFGSITCLNPIRSLLRQPQVTQLSELLHHIEGEIVQVGSYNLPKTYHALPSYSTAQIHAYIKQLITHVD